MSASLSGQPDPEVAVSIAQDYLLAKCPNRLVLSQDDFLSTLIASEPVQTVMDAYRQPLQALFVSYAQPHDRDAVMHWSVATSRIKDSVGMSFSQLWELAIDAKLLPQISRKQLQGILVCATDGITETCSFTQFEEILVRCAQVFVGTPVSSSDALVQAIVEMFAHMDSSPALATVTGMMQYTQRAAAAGDGILPKALGQEAAKRGRRVAPVAHPALRSGHPQPQ